MVMQRVAIGRDVNAILEREDGIELEGRARLRPGHDVDIVMVSTHAASPTVRRAVVWCWYVKRLGRDGPIFRGVCHWTT